VWARVSADCSTARAAAGSAAAAAWRGSTGGRPTLRNRGGYGGGLLPLPARPCGEAVVGWRIRWVLHYEKGEPIIGLVDASIADIDGSAIFYDPSFCGMSCKRGSVWRGEVAMLQASDADRRCAKGSVLRCELRPDGGPSGPLVFSVERRIDGGEAEEPTTSPPPTAGSADAVGGGDTLGPEASKCGEWSIRRLWQWLQLYDPTPHPETSAVLGAAAGADERAVLAARVQCVAAWLHHDAALAAGAGDVDVDGAAEGGAAGVGRREKWERMLRIAMDPSVRDWAGACYSAGSFKMTLLMPAEMEILEHARPTKQ
jgi:hypothetical protein